MATAGMVPFACCAASVASHLCCHLAIERWKGDRHQQTKRKQRNQVVPVLIAVRGVTLRNMLHSLAEFSLVKLVALSTAYAVHPYVISVKKHASRRNHDILYFSVQRANAHPRGGYSRAPIRPLDHRYPCQRCPSGLANPPPPLHDA